MTCYVLYHSSLLSGREVSDLNPSDFGVVMLELLAFVGDNVHYYIDRMAAESFLPTAITRRSIVNLLKLIDYNLRGNVAASADVTFTLAVPLPDALTIPAWTLLKTICDRPGSQNPNFANNIYFETSADLVIPAGALTGTVTAIQGKTSFYTVLGQSDGLPNQSFAIPETPVIEDTPRVFVDEGLGKQEWQILDTLIEKQSCDKCCVVQRNADGTNVVYFGDNGQGKIPDPGSTIYATYRIGGGSEGNVGADTITLIDSPLTFAGSPITATVTNPSDASGGEDEQSNESARIDGPRTLRALYRAVTAEDFEALTDDFPGVARSKAVAGQWEKSNRSNCCPVSMFIVPAGGGYPSTQLKLDLIAYLDTRKVECICVEVFDPQYQPVNIRGTCVVYSNFDVADVRNTMLARIDAYFDEIESPYTGFDKAANVSDITALMDDTDGIDHVDLSEITRQPAPRFIQWTGDAAFDDAEWVIGEDSQSEEWTVAMTSPTTYSVTGTVTGFAGNGALGSPFVTSRLRFVLNPGTTGNAPGDFVKFRTSPKLANVSMLPGEFFTKGVIDLTFVVGGIGPTSRCV